MFFYAYDLEGYVRKRDFYFNFRSFVPGEIFYDQESLAQAVKTGTYDRNKVRQFAETFFDIRDGQASRRVADLIYSLTK